MGLKYLLERLLESGVATPDTPKENEGYPPQCPVHGGCTPDPPDSSSCHVSETEGVLGPAHDRWCWPFSNAMNTTELGRFTARVARFTDNALPLVEAEALADRLVIRDRDGDDRRMCLECAHLSGRRCGAWQRAAIGGPVLPTSLLALPQRCGAFDSSPMNEDVAGRTPPT